MNPKDRRHFNRWTESLQWSSRTMKPHRENRREAVALYCGAHYAEGKGGSISEEDKQPVNSTEVAVNTFLQLLASNAPRVLVTTPYTSLKETAMNLRIALNFLIEEIKFGKTFRRAVLEAMFAPFGAIKTAMSVAQKELEGFLYDVGQPFAAVVDFDDFLWDMTAKSAESIMYCGHRYRVPKEMLLDSGFLTGISKDRLAQEDQTPYNKDGDLRVSTFSTGIESTVEGEEHVDLWEFWLPRENLVVTLNSQWSFPALDVREWAGPEIGPLHYLSFSEVPGNIMPVAPVAHMYDLASAMNHVLRKVIRQAERQKTFGTYQKGTEDGNTIKNVSDGEMVGLDGGKVEEKRVGGADQAALATFIQLKDLFSWNAGNLDSLAGLSAMSETARQDELIYGAASQRIKGMGQRVLEFAQEVVKSLALYLFNPMIHLPLTRRIYGGEDTIEFTSDTLKGSDYLQYNFVIEPYSMRYQTPEERAKRLLQLHNEVLVPATPALQAQGIVLDYEKFLQILSDNLGMPEIRDILIFMNGSPGSERSPIGERPLQSPTTTRVERRVSGGAAIQPNRDMAMMQALLGGKSNFAGASR